MSHSIGVPYFCLKTTAGKNIWLKPMHSNAFYPPAKAGGNSAKLVLV